MKLILKKNFMQQMFLQCCKNLTQNVLTNPRESVSNPKNKALTPIRLISNAFNTTPLLVSSQLVSK